MYGKYGLEYKLEPTKYMLESRTGPNEPFKLVGIFNTQRDLCKVLNCSMWTINKIVKFGSDNLKITKCF